MFNKVIKRRSDFGLFFKIFYVHLLHIELLTLLSSYGDCSIIYIRISFKIDEK